MRLLLDYEIISKGKIILRHITDNENISEELMSQISNYWNSYVKSKNSSIFNDKVLRFVRINPNNENEIYVTFTDTKILYLIDFF